MSESGTPEAILSADAIAFVVGATFGNEYERMIHDLAASHEALRARLAAQEEQTDAWHEAYESCDDRAKVAVMRAEAAEGRVTALTLALRDVLTLTDSPVLHAERVAAARAVLASSGTEPTGE